jgi:acyl-CoA dehydrogenase
VFEGVQVLLVKIVGYTYLAQALRIFTASHIDEGLSPVVASAIAKYNSTAYGRCVINAAFDLHGGKAICLGPKNYLNEDYISSPIGITVEGANILTRSMIVFGQGAIRCHPYVLSEIKAADEVDSKVGLVKFDRLFWSHCGFIISNHFRSFFLGLTNAYFVRVKRKKSMRRYYQLATRFSTILALVSDVAMISLGSDLKRKESLSGRLADMVSILYIVTTVLKFYEHASKHAEDEDDLNVAKWVCIDQFKKFEQILHEFLVNLPNRWVGRYLRLFCLPLGRFLNSPTDHLMRKISRSVMAPSRLRDRFKTYAAGYSSDSSIVSQIESALESLVNNEPLEKKIYQAKKEGLISGIVFDNKKITKQTS